MNPPPRWVEQYQSIPFVSHGATREGCNCWGLIALVLEERCGIVLDRYSSISAEDVLSAERAMRRGRDDRDTWRMVDRQDVRPFDVVVMRDLGRKVERHVGVMVTPVHVLHIEAGTDAVCLPIMDRMIASRIVEFRRHRSLV